MTTLALPRKKLKAFYQPVADRLVPYSSYAIASILCIALFLGFLGMYPTPVFEALSSTSKAMLSMLFVVITPALALLFSIISLRRYVKFHTEVRGMFLAYISFFISSLYFVTALAMPIVLLGLYLMYVYIW